MGKYNGGFQLNATKCDINEDAIAEIERAQEDSDDSMAINKPMPYVPLKVPLEQRQKIMSEYTCAVAQDFFDDYNMTEEEKKEAFAYYELFKTLDSVKAKTKRLDTFVEYYRKTMACLNVVAEDNGVYPKDKFISLVLKGKIKVSGLRFPRYSGNRKTVNWKRVMEFILDTSLNPEELVAVKTDMRYDVSPEERYKFISETVYGGNIDQVLEDAAKDTVPTNQIFDLDVEDTSGKNIVIPADQKISKKYMKRYGVESGLLDGLKEYKNSKRTQNQLADYIFEMRQSDFERIERMNEERDSNGSSVPVFKGELFNTTDYDLYMRALEEYERNHTFVTVNDKVMTLAEWEELALKDSLDSEGWNVREMYDYREQEKREAKREARREKEKKRLKKRLAKIGSMGNGVNSKKKRHKKHKKDSVKGKLDAAVGSILSGNYSNFDAYTEEMERFGDGDEE